MNPSRSSTMAAIASLSVSAAILVMTTMNGALAEEQNTIQIRGGETIEIATDAGSPEAEFSWILTRDRKFLSGQRTRFFQTRLTDPGTYTLDVSVQNPKTGENALRTFTLIVTEPAPDALPDTTDRTGMPLRSMVSTEPATLNGIVYLPPNGGILKIDASKSEGKIETYSIDLDTNTDSDSDGNPTNDRDNIGTLSEKSGSAVYFFALPKPAPRAVRVTVTDLSGAGPSSVDLPLSFTSSPTIPSSSVGVIQNVNGPIAVEQKDLDVTLAVNLNDPNLQGKQLLYEWDFGDRSRSLLDKPTHTYALAGMYVVTLTIRDISTAQVLQSISTTVQVAEPVLSSSSATQSESSASSSSASSSGSGSTSSFSLWSVIKVLFIIILLLGIAIGLYVLLTWIKKRTTSSIQQTLEKMEETIVKKDPKETAPEAAAPMNLKKDVVDVSVKKAPEDVAEREKSRPDFQVQKRPNETPLTSAGPVPPWLKNSSAPAEKATSTPVAAPTSAPAPSPAPKPAPAPAPAPKPTAAPAPTPAPATTAKAAPAPITAPVTTPKATPAPTATTSPAPKPPASVPAPAAKAAPVAGTNPSTAPVAAPAAKPPVQPSGTAPKATPVVTQAAPSAPKPSAAPAAVKPPAAEKPKQVTNPTPNPKVSPVPSVAQEEVPKPNVVSKPIPKVESKPIEKDDSDPPIAIIQADSIST